MNTEKIKIDEFTMKCTYEQGLRVYDILHKNDYMWGVYNSLSFFDKIYKVCVTDNGFGYLILWDGFIFFVDDKFPDSKDDSEITYDYFINRYTLKGQRKIKLQNLVDEKDY